MGGGARLSVVAVGGVLLVVGLAATLTRAVPVRTGTNGMLADATLGVSAGKVTVCQDTELVPAGTGAVRVSLNSAGQAGPPLALVVKDGRATIGRGALASGWSGETATVAMHPVVRAEHYASVCLRIGDTASVVLQGEARPGAGQPASAAGAPLRGRLRFEYLAPDRRTWSSQVGEIARRMSFGHAIGGPAVALVTVLLTLGAASLGLWQLVRGER